MKQLFRRRRDDRKLVKLSVINKMTLVVLSVLILSNCWDYTSLNEQTVVAGIAVDQGEGGNGFALTFEIVDLSGAEAGQFGSIVLKTTGETLAEAVYAAYAKLHNRVYLGITDVVIVSRAQAEEGGIRSIVDYLIRNQKARNSLRIVVAGTERAADLLAPAEAEEGETEGPSPEEGERPLLSQALSESLGARQARVQMSTEARGAYEVFNILARGTSDLVLPIVGTAEAADIPFQLGGLAIFRGDRMVGILEQSDVPLYLLATAGLRDRAFPVEVAGPDGVSQRVVILLRQSRSHIDYVVVEGVLCFLLDIHLTADAVELPPDWGMPDQEMLRRIEGGAALTLSKQVTDLAVELRDAGRDIFGFGERVQNRDPKLWAQMAGRWPDYLGNSEIETRVAVRLQNAGMMGR
ncbi:MAG: hypothetical protein FWC72_07255 [Oscillospiraceae bacterium]|nr:hypothetical protein [Oscillospiraceae bacterium]